jgi:hypothetical protein
MDIQCFCARFSACRAPADACCRPVIPAREYRSNVRRGQNSRWHKMGLSGCTRTDGMHRGAGGTPDVSTKRCLIDTFALDDESWRVRGARGCGTSHTTRPPSAVRRTLKPLDVMPRYAVVLALRWARWLYAGWLAGAVVRIDRHRPTTAARRRALDRRQLDTTTPGQAGRWRSTVSVLVQSLD